MEIRKLQFPPELARAEGVSAETIRNWCEKGLIKGAHKQGALWLIPKPAEIDKPTQGRPWPSREVKDDA